jgi:hypothetical protein
MAYTYPGEGSLDYFPCRYGRSKLMFRGPRRDLTQPYVAVFGGTETYGKFLPQPYPALVEAALGLPMVNLGCINAGTDVYLNDPAVIEIAAKARAVVIQITGAANLTNRFYAVHPRRNDRFLRAAPLLQTIFREVDFTEFHFTRHMLRTLNAVSPEKFEVLAEELRAAWVARMKLLISRLPTRVVLLWVADHAPVAPGRQGDVAHDPLLVDADMIATLRPLVSGYVEAVASPAARACGTEGMRFSALDEPAARGLPGPAVHAEVAAALATALSDLV